MKLLVIYYIYIKYKLQILLVHTFRAHANRISMQQKLFQNVFTTSSWSLQKEHRKGSAKATPKIEKICILCIYKEYLFCLQSNESGNFLQKSINFVE